MRLLFDQNISFKVAKRIQDVFPGAKHLSDLRIEHYQDMEIWKYAKEENYCIVTFDSDFIDISTLKGFPPKIIWLRIGNTSTDNIVERLRKESGTIIDFISSHDEAFLEIK